MVDFRSEAHQILATRKDYKCAWCNEMIPKGGSCFSWVSIDGGQASTLRVHEECYEAMQEVIREYDGEMPPPGENPRGCNCGFTEGCERCDGRKKLLDKLLIDSDKSVAKEG